MESIKLNQTQYVNAINPYPAENKCLAFANSIEPIHEVWPGSILLADQVFIFMISQKGTGEIQKSQMDKAIRQFSRVRATDDKDSTIIVGRFYSECEAVSTN